MADHAADDGANAYPSVERIARFCSISERSVRYAVHELVRRGYLTLEKAARQHRPASYFVDPRGAARAALRGAGAAALRNPGVQIASPGVQIAYPRGAGAAPNPKRTKRTTHLTGDAKPPPMPDRYEVEFETIVRPLYPNRSGDQRWKAALGSFRAARKLGEPLEAFTTGVIRYAGWCKATGKTGTERVKQAGSFFGTEKCWREPWHIPDARGAASGYDPYKGSREDVTCPTCGADYVRRVGYPDEHRCSEAHA